MRTVGVIEKADPVNWKRHLYGLSRERWASLGGKSFWVTGAGTGYGRSISVGLAAAGAQVFLTGRRRTKLEETLKEMAGYGVLSDCCHLMVADITDPGQREGACNEVKKLCAHLYGLIHCAAIPERVGYPYPLKDETEGYWELMVRTNVSAPWLISRSILPHMLGGGAGRVLFLSSEAGWAFTPGFGLYNASKAALNSLAGSMAEECATHSPAKDMQINVLVPGEARTEMNRNSSESPYSVVSMALILLSHPKGGPNGRFFHRDGRHLQFAYASAYGRPLMGDKA